MRSRRAVAAILILAAGLGLARAQNSDGYWSAGTGGSWINAANWDSGVIADGADNTAFFGINLEPPINSTNAVFTLDGARTIGYINFYGPGSAANWSLNTGTGGPLTLNASFDVPAVYVNPASLQLTVNAVLAGTNGFETTGLGTVVLTANNSYTGGTSVSAGALLMNGILNDTNPVTVAGGAILGGTGMISGPLVVQSNGVFSPGNPPGTFTVGNSLNLQAGSKTTIAVNASTLAHSRVAGISMAAYGGILTVSNLAGTPATGLSFPIFSAASATGNFSGITPQLTGNVRWRFDPSSGVLSVVGTTQPRFAAMALVNAVLIFSVTNGVPGATNYLLAATNLAQSRSTWTRMATNVFDVSGNLAVSNSINATVSQRFYLISVP